MNEHIPSRHDHYYVYYYYCDVQVPTCYHFQSVRPSQQIDRLEAALLDFQSLEWCISDQRLLIEQS